MGVRPIVVNFRAFGAGAASEVVFRANRSGFDPYRAPTLAGSRSQP